MLAIIHIQRCLILISAALLLMIFTLSLTNRMQISAPSVQVVDKNLMNLTDFQFLIHNELLCRETTSTGHKLLLMFVLSAPNNFVKRDLIRRTWGSVPSLKDWDIKLAFLLGKSVNSEAFQIENNAKLLAESSKHRDIIVGNFEDTYRNLSYKQPMGFKWMFNFCPTSNYLLKTDDDVFIEIFQLVNHIRKLKSTNTISCSINRNFVPQRLRKERWYVTREEFPLDVYPDYCSGMGILMSADVVKVLYSASMNAKYFWIEDVFVTGVLRQNLTNQQFKMLDFSSKYNYAEAEKCRNWYKNPNITSRLPWIYVHTWDENFEHDIKQLWKKTLTLQSSSANKF